MDDALGMRRVESIRELNRHIQQQLSSHRPAHDSVLQSHAIEKLHHDERLALMLPDLENRADIWVIQSRGSARFPAEAFKGLRISRDIIGQKFQRDEAP